MAIVNMHEAKTHLSRLVEQALAGEEVIIAKSGKPLVKLAPVGRELTPRPLGTMKGLIWIAPDFDDTPEDIIALFEGSEE